MNGMTTVLTAPNELETREYEVPDPGPGSLILEMVRANVCGSEVPIVHGRHPLIGPGCVIGHEGVGRVSRIGAGADRDSTGATLSEGDRVVATYFGACRRCPECNNGHPNVCRNAYAGWSTPADESPHFHGTFGSHYHVHSDQAVVKVPDSVSSKAVSAANCALSQVTYGVELGELHMGQSVVILGAGGLGVCAAAVAKEAGAEVFVAEMVPGRLAKAEEFGAHHTIDLSVTESTDDRVALLKESVGGAGPDLVIDLTGVPDAFNEAVRATRATGKMVSIGNISPNRTTAFDPGLFTRTGVQIRAAIRYPAPVLGRAVRFIEATPQYPWEDLVDADYSLSDVKAAVAAAEEKKVTRAGILFDD